MTLPDGLLGTSLITYLNQNFSAGTWVDDKGNATSSTQATSALRPVADNTVAPSGRTMLLFNGSTQYLEGAAIPTGVINAWSGTMFFVEFGAFLRTWTTSSVTERLIDYDANEETGLESNQFYRSGLFGDTPNIDATNIQRFIIVHNAATLVTNGYINGILQSGAGSNSTATRTDWVNVKGLGGRFGGTGDFFHGYLGCLGWAQQATWTSTDTANLDVAIATWIGTKISPVGIASGETFGRANVFGGFRQGFQLYRRFPGRMGGNARDQRGSLLIGPSSRPPQTNVLFSNGFFPSIVQPSGIASAEVFGSPTVSLGGGGGSQTISPSGIAPAFASGATKLGLSVSPSGVVAGYASGTAKVNRTVAPAGLASAYASGTAKVNLTVAPTGIFPGYASGSAIVKPITTISATGIASGYASGTAKLNLALSTTAIASAYASGTAKIVIAVAPSAIASGYASGTATLNFAIAPTGIIPGFAAGTAKLNFFVDPSAIGSGYASGAAHVGSTTSVLPTGIGSAYTSGSAKVNLNLAPVGISTAIAFGSTVVGRGPVTLSPSGIGSAYASGSATVSRGSGVQTIAPAGVGSAEAFGTARLDRKVLATAIASGYASGTARLQLVVAPSSVSSGNAFGTPLLATGPVAIHPISVASGESFGSAIVHAGGVLLAPTGIASGEAFGAARFGLSLDPIGITTGESFGSAILLVDQTLFALAIASVSAFGATHVSAPFVVPTRAPIIGWSSCAAARIVVRFEPSARVAVVQTQAVATAVTPSPAAKVAFVQSPAAKITVRQTMALFVGSVNRITFTFQDPDTLAFYDPPAVMLDVQSPSQRAADPDSATTYVYGVAAEITKVSTGKYRALILCTEKGSWAFSPKSTGTNAGVGYGFFDVAAAV